MMALCAWLALALLPQQTPEQTKAQAPAQTKAQAPAQEATQPAAASTVSVAQLEQLVAPIALYPDSLLAQLLMASTYPIEIVEAARWLKKNPGLKGDALETALMEQTWDPAVKSMCGFADVVQRMSDNLDWTQDLGDAFLGQQAELMDAVQSMRRKAFDAGNLKSSKELKVTEKEDKIIVIEPAEPEVIYVPTYYPTAVYGSWSYPYWYYPPMYPPAPAGGAWFGFTVGVVWGAAIWGNCNWGWGHTEIDIDVDHHHEFVDRTERQDRRQDVKDRSGNAQGKQGKWQHDPSHRKGVGYKDGKTAQQFGAGPGQTRVSRDQARGFSDRSAQTPSQRAIASGTRDMGAQASDRSGASRSSGNARGSRASTGERSGSFSGSRDANFDRASSSRGRTSRDSMGSRSRSSGARSRGRGR